MTSLEPSNVSATCDHSFSGYLITRNAAGETMRREFMQKYSVIPAPTGATVAADLTLPTAFIRTRTVAAWRRDPVTIGKRPCVFIVLA